MKKPKASDYKGYDTRTHVYNKPSMYIGSVDNLIRDDWLLEDVMVYKEIDFIPGCERLFLEILSNASDNAGRSKRSGVDPGSIVISMDHHTIKIKNGGLSIPLEIHPEFKIYVPEMIFGRFLTSSNYEVERHDIGTNGIGAKATNVFSQHFKVIIVNDHKKYTQVWENNMLICHPPTIEASTEPPSVTIEYVLDFKKFKYKEYPEEAFKLFARHAADTSFTCKLPVMFNNQLFNYSDIAAYAALYFGDTEKIIHVQKKKNNVVVELIILDTPDDGIHVSFVNGMMTKDGGVHVNTVYKLISEPIINQINDQLYKKFKNLDARELKSRSVNLADIKQNISIILSCQLVDPELTGQCKSYLSKPIPDIHIKNEVLKPIQNWQLMTRLTAILEAKQMASMAKTDGKKTKHVDIDIKGWHDAADAATKKSQECILCLTEGKSGAGYVNVYIASMENSNLYGVLPLKGKCLNVMKAEDAKIEQNREIKAIKTALGLQENTDYTDPVNFKKLRYGQIMICTDSDLDGKHITGLILNIFHCRFPSLLKREGFIIGKRTPIIRVINGKKVNKFYTQREYELWTGKGHVKYYKGLGTSTRAEVIDDIKDEQLVTYTYDKDAADTLSLVFGSSLGNKRKEWITNWKPRNDVDTMIIQPISLFINHEFILFSKSDNIRSINNLLDGFKEAHRKIVAGSHKKFNIGPLNKKYQEIKVADLDSYIRTELNYHHGTDILGKAIILMAQDFVGSNNINLFEPDGQFGTRLENGRDASSTRYINTYPSAIFPYIFMEDDQDLLKYKTDEGKTIEPETYLPIIPIILVNGTKGIGTGYSTHISCHNPSDIVTWLQSRLKGEVDLPSIKPWYRGFTGQIVIIDRRKLNQYKNLDINEDVNLAKEEVDGVDNNIKPLFSIVMTGIYCIRNDTIIITELPIGLSPDQYLDTIKDFLENKKIKGYKNESTADKIYFELTGFQGNVSYETLGIRRRISLSNMVLLDKNCIPQRYDTANDIMETFYTERLPYYHQRKEVKLTKIKNKLTQLNFKIQFINAIINQELIINNVSKQSIIDKMIMLKIPVEIYTEAKLSHLNKEEVAQLKKEVDIQQKEYTKLDKISPAQLWLNDLNQFYTKYKELYK